MLTPPMAGILSGFGNAVLWALEAAINALILAVGVLIGTVLGLLPGLPDTPDGPTPQALGWIAWFFPVGGVLAGLVVMVGLYTVFLGLRIVLRWVKAL
jgi:hypothetical protein